MVNRKELNPDAGPEAAYGARLRRVREARGWKQDDLAERIGYTGRHVSGVETAGKPPTRQFSAAVDAALGLAGTAESFSREWGEIRHGVLLEGFPEYVGCEGRASEVRLFELGLVPGLMQTPAYARSLAEGEVQRGSIPPEGAEERVQFLAARQAALRRPRAPMVLVVMDESCLYQQVGSSDVMDEQFSALLSAAARPNWVLQVAPFSLGARRAFNLPVNLLTMPDRSVVVYAESQAQGHVVRDIEAVLPFVTSYHQLQAEALSQAESVALIKRLRKGRQ